MHTTTLHQSDVIFNRFFQLRTATLKIALRNRDGRMLVKVSHKLYIMAGCLVYRVAYVFSETVRGYVFQPQIITGSFQVLLYLPLAKLENTALCTDAIITAIVRDVGIDCLRHNISAGLACFFLCDIQAPVVAILNNIR